MLIRRLTASLLVLTLLAPPPVAMGESRGFSRSACPTFFQTEAMGARFALGTFWPKTMTPHIAHHHWTRRIHEASALGPRLPWARHFNFGAFEVAATHAIRAVGAVYFFLLLSQAVGFEVPFLEEFQAWLSRLFGSVLLSATARPIRTKNQRELDVHHHVQGKATIEAILRKRTQAQRAEALLSDPDLNAIAANSSLSRVYTEWDKWLGGKPTDLDPNLFVRFVENRARAFGKIDTEAQVKYTRTLYGLLETQYPSLRLSPLDAESGRLYALVSPGKPEERQVIMEVIDSQDDEASGGHYLRLPDIGSLAIYLFQLQAKAIRGNWIHEVLNHELYETLRRRLGESETEANVKTRLHEAGISLSTELSSQEDPAPFSPGMHHALPASHPLEQFLARHRHAARRSMRFTRRAA